MKHIHLPASSTENRGNVNPCNQRVGADVNPVLPQVLALDMRGLLQAVPVSRTFVYQEIKDKRLTATKLGRRTIFLVEDVRSWLHGLGGQDRRR